MTDGPIEAPEASPADEFHKAHNKGIGSIWVIVIVIGILTPVTYGVVKWTNDSQDRQQAQYRQQLETKFQQALAISSAQYAFSINKSVCGFRGFVQPTIDRALKRRDDYPNLTPAARALNENAIKTGRRFLGSQVTVPADFKCKALAKKPPKPGRTP